MKITEEMTHLAYNVSQDVYAGKMSKEDAIEIVHKKTGMNQNSVLDYIRQVKCMMDGECFARSNSIYAIEYMLGKIKSDYDPERLKNALKALSEHIDYQQTIGTTKYSLISILDRFKRILQKRIS